MTAELMLIILAGFAVYTLISWFSWEIRVRVGGVPRSCAASQFIWGTLWPFGLLADLVAALYALRTWRK